MGCGAGKGLRESAPQVHIVACFLAFSCLQFVFFALCIFCLGSLLDWVIIISYLLHGAPFHVFYFCFLC